MIRRPSENYKQIGIDKSSNFNNRDHVVITNSLLEFAMSEYFDNFDGFEIIDGFDLGKDRLFCVVPVKCPYCNGHVSLKDSDIIYGKSYGKVYICDSYPLCDSYVGVHKGTLIPLGRLANEELRYWKKQAHFYFDGYWRGKMGRKRAYFELSVALGIPIEEAHIGMFDIEMCKRVVELYK